MRTARLARQLPWLAPLLVSCGPHVSLETGSESSADGTTEVMSTMSTQTESTTPGTTTGAATIGDTLTGDTTAGRNAAPEAIDDVVFASQNQALVLDAASGLLSNDTDPDGDPLTVVDFDADSASGGVVAIDDDGGVSYDPPAGFWGPDGFGYSIEDDEGAAAEATVTVYVAPAQIPLVDVAAGMGGFALDGEAVGDYSGRSVSGAGDVNGDGMDDIIVGAFRADPNGHYSGRSYVVFGRPDTTALPLSSIAGGVGGFVLDGEAPDDQSGLSVSGAGDVNGDGMDDIIIGANGAGPNGRYSGRSYVVFGKADTTAVQLTAITAGMGGFVLDGEAEYDNAAKVSGAGDVNGDGMDDIIVGAAAADPNGELSGRSYVVFGKADTAAVLLSAITGGAGGFVIDGEATSDLSGGSVSDAGDVNGDGMDDIIVGAQRAAPNGDDSGRSYVVFGKVDTAAVQLSAVTAGMGGFVLDGEAADHDSGGSVSGAGDVNGDGMDDLIVGASGADPNGRDSGRSYVVFGKADTTAVHLSAIVGGIGGFVLDGEAEIDRSGSSVSGAGDVNGDGMDDVIVGAPSADPVGGGSGKGYVVFGKADTAVVQLSAIAAGVGGFVLDGEAGGYGSGRSVSRAGDINGDGTDDVVVGADTADFNGYKSGRSYVVFGVPTGGT